MYKFIFTLTFISATLSSYAQNDSVGGLRPSIGLGASGGYSFPSEATYLKNIIGGNFNTSIYVNGMYPVTKNKKLILFFDVGYVNRGFTIKNIPNTTYVIDDNGLIDYSNTTYYNVSRQRHSVYAKNSLGIVVLKVGEKLNLLTSIGGGAYYCFRISESSKGLSDEYAYVINYTGDDIARKWAFVLDYSIGISYAISKRFVLIASPYVEFQVNSLGEIVPDRELRIFNTGVNLRFNYNLK
jgi:hypothetical protein